MVVRVQLLCLLRIVNVVKDVPRCLHVSGRERKNKNELQQTLLLLLLLLFLSKCVGCGALSRCVGALRCKFMPSPFQTSEQQMEQLEVVVVVADFLSKLPGEAR